MTDQERASAEPRARSAPRLLDAFRELHAEVIRSARALTGHEPPDQEAVKQRLLAVLTRQAADARDRLAEHELAELDEAQYVMIAMADEVFLHLAWAGRDAWAHRPLEAESRFGTHVAGERFFTRLRDLLAPGGPPVSSELLSVYLAALTLGFRGRYRFEPAATEPQARRRELVVHLRRLDPRMVAPASELCPAALGGVRDKEPRRGLTNLREGMLPLVAVVALMLALGHVLWFYRTSDVRDRLDRIEEGRDKLEKQQRIALELRERAREKAARDAVVDGGAP